MLNGHNSIHCYYFCGVTGHFHDEAVSETGGESSWFETSADVSGVSVLNHQMIWSQSLGQILDILKDVSFRSFQIPGLGGQFGQPPLCLLTLLLQLLICSPCDGSTRFFSYVSDRFRDHIESYSVAASSPFCRKKGAQNFKTKLSDPERDANALTLLTFLMGSISMRVVKGSQKACHGTGRG